MVSYRIRQDNAGLLRAPAVFVLFWITLFLLYLPAANAGWVSDTLGWVDAVQSQSFRDFVMRKGFGVPSFYQLTQIVTWCLYQVLGTNHWAWHLVHLSLHATNATLVFTLFRGLFRDCNIENSETPALVAATLFCTSPYVSEVVVWEASFHFLQGLMFVLLQLHLLRQFLLKARRRLIAVSLSLYCISLFSLELFCLVPFLSAGLCLLYYARGERLKAKKGIRAFVLPQTLLLLLYFGGLRLLAGQTTGRLGDEWMKLPITFYLVKPPEYLFHLLGGRFLPQDWRLHLYSACSSYIGAGIFYLTLLACTSYMAFRFRWMNRPNQLAGFLFFWLLLSITLVSTLWFPERLLIIGDRYLYALLPPFWGIVVLLLTRRIKILLLRQGLISILLIMQMLGTLRLSLTWRQSAELTDRLQSTLTDAPDKVTILLNNPASLNGAAMIGAGSDGEARLMHNLFYSRPIRGVMFDAPAANLLGQADSIHIQQLDSRAVRVSLTRPGAFWQYGPDVAHSFGNSAFNVEVENHNCCYVLRLADTPARYRLLYQQNGNWREFHFSDK